MRMQCFTKRQPYNEQINRKEKRIMKKNNKGFTLAELLIVVAIIAVLVAIAIPIFTSQLEKSREATDLANVRSAYAEIVTAAMTEETEIVSNSADIEYVVDDATAGSYVYTATVTLHQAVDGWATVDADKAVAGVTATGTPTAKGKATITFTENNETVTIKYE